MNILEGIDSHSLSLELRSLRAALSHYQHEAYAASVKLQHHSLEASNATHRTQLLLKHNARLREELASFHAHPDVTPTSDGLKVQELTLALRRLSDKLDFTEAALSSQVNECINARSDAVKASYSAEAALSMVNKLQAQWQEQKLATDELKRHLHAVKMERDQSDIAISEYANLVRTLEGRLSMPDSSTSSLGSGEKGAIWSIGNAQTSQNQSSLQDMNKDVGQEVKELESEIMHLQNRVTSLEVELEAEKNRAISDRELRVTSQQALHQLESDNNAAAKMVSRYMKFSQTSSDLLHAAMEHLKARHFAALNSQRCEIENLQDMLMKEQKDSNRLRRALDELTEDLSREGYGRRREISLRLALLTREERLHEALKRWVLKSREALDNTSSPEQLPNTFKIMIEHAEAFLQFLDQVPESTSEITDSSARLVLAQSLLTTTLAELEVQTNKRTQLEKLLATHSLGAPLSAPDNVILSAEPSHRTYSSPPHKYQATENHNANGGIDASVSYKLTSTAGPISDTTLGDSQQSPNQINSSKVVPIDPQPSGEDVTLSQEQNIISTSQAPLESPHSTKEPNLYGNHGPPTTQNISSPQVTPNVGDVTFKERAGDESLLQVNGSLPSLSLAPLEDLMPEEKRGLADVKLEDASPVASLSRTRESSSSSPILNEVLQDTLNPLPLDVRVTPSEPNDNLLESLASVATRYDSLQQLFKNCHLALQDVKREAESSRGGLIMEAFRDIIGRLDDYTEDARVELEIRIADDERVCKGYETLLLVPGALSDLPDVEELRRKIQTFSLSTNPDFVKFEATLQRKADDILHDIAIIKRAMHDLSSAQDDDHIEANAASTSWPSWRSTLLSSRPSSPATSPSFGVVMTAPRTRHSAEHYPDIRTPTKYFSGLGLRIATPTTDHIPSSSAAPRLRKLSSMFSLGLGGPTPPITAQRSFSSSEPHQRHQHSLSVEDDIE